MDTDMVIIVIAALFFLALLGLVVARMRKQREVGKLETEAVDRQESAADRQAEAAAIVSDADRERRMAEEAAERARELQAEADRRSEVALEREAEADQVATEASEEQRLAEEARLAAEERR